MFSRYYSPFACPTDHRDGRISRKPRLEIDVFMSGYSFRKESNVFRNNKNLYFLPCYAFTIVGKQITTNIKCYQLLLIDDRKDLRVCMACILALCKHAYWYIWPFANTYIYIFLKNLCIFYPILFSTIFCKSYFLDTHVCVDGLFFFLNSVNCVYQPAYSRDLIKKICYQVGLEPVSPFMGVNTVWSSVLCTAQQQRESSISLL